MEKWYKYMHAPFKENLFKTKDHSKSVLLSIMTVIDPFTIIEVHVLLFLLLYFIKKKKKNFYFALQKSNTRVNVNMFIIFQNLWFLKLN